MGTPPIAETILSLIENHQGRYPITIRELQDQLGCSNAWVNGQLRKLQTARKIHSRKVTWMKGYQVFHLPAGVEWTPFLSTTCGKCHYRSTIKTCVLHNDLQEHGYPCDYSRVGVKLPKDCVSCPEHIPRVTRLRRKPLEVFLALSSRKKCLAKVPHELLLTEEEEFFSEESFPEEMLPRYYCLFCSYPLHQLGRGFFPLLGSSSTRCFNCESLYKLEYNYTEEKFYVVFAEERGDLYREKFQQLAGVPCEVEPYSSNFFGVVIPKEGHYILDTVTETLIIDNWMGLLSSLDYIVTRSKKDYQELKAALAEDYPDIQLIDGQELLISPEPTAEQVGLLRLLRKTKLMNASFCRTTLESRKTVLCLLKGSVNEEKRLKGLAVVEKQLRLLGRYQLLDAKTWNTIDMHAAKAMFEPIKELFEDEGITFSGRGLERFVKCPFKPYNYYYAYTVINTIINGLMEKTEDLVKECCAKIKLCWDGLPGLCHVDTHGGQFEFHLDLVEPFKLVTLVAFCTKFNHRSVDIEKVHMVLGRRRQKLYCVKAMSELNRQLDELVEQAFQRRGRKHSIRLELEEYFLQVKLWLQGLVVRSYTCRILHHGQHFTSWAVMTYQLWEFLTEEQKESLKKQLTRSLEAIPFEPYVFQSAN